MRKNNLKILFLLYLSFLFFFNKASYSANLTFIGEKPAYFRSVNAPIRSILEKFLPSLAVNYLGKIDISGTIISSSFSTPNCFPPLKKEELPKDKGFLSVVSANLFMLPFPFSIDNRHRIELFRKKIEKYDPDIIGLQEIWLNQDLQELRKAFPEYYSIWIPTLLYNRTGLLILSKLPVKNAFRKIYPIGIDCRAQELLAQKGFLQIALSYRNMNINIINTHFYSTSDYTKIKRNKNQFKILKSHLKSLKNPTIVLGDLNLKPSSLEELNQGFLTYNKLKKTTVFGNKRLDYILIPADGRISLIKTDIINSKPDVSDHYPILGILKVN